MRKSGPWFLIISVITAWAFWPRFVFSHAATTNTVLFDREIVRILDEHCVMCHTRDGPSVSLASFEEAWLARRSIHDQVLAGHMPPWAAVPGYGKFVNANGLTLREKRFIVSWVEGLGPRNTGSVFLNVSAPGSQIRQEIRAQPRFEQWRLAEPDRVLPVAATIEPGSAMQVQRTVVNLGLTSESWLRGFEYRPANRRLVRAAVFTVARTGQWLGTWTPWHGFRLLPSGLAYRLPAGAEIIAEIHAIGADEATMELGSLGLLFADEPTSAALSELVLEATGAVAAGVSGYRLRAEMRLDTETHTLALWLDLSSGIESIEVTATHPNGRVEVLLYALDIALDWPAPYVFEVPPSLPEGTRLAVTAYASNNEQTLLQSAIRVVISVY